MQMLPSSELPSVTDDSTYLGDGLTVAKGMSAMTFWKEHVTGPAGRGGVAAKYRDHMIKHECDTHASMVK